jgi:hypothetical protein
MKAKLIILITFLVTITTFAQQGINYKAIVKDNLGNVVANQSVTVQFTINQGIYVVYQEDHTVNTDANGLVILNIGTGNILSGNFDTIDWSTGNYYLKVQIDTGSGLVDLGSTQFRTVPFALYAQNSIAKGLEALDQGNGIGWRLVGKTPNHYGDLGLNAVDFSTYDYNSGQHGARGNYSFATGYGTEASGSSSIAFGNGTVASGYESTAFGYHSEASGDRSAAFGYYSEASGSNSFAFGNNSTASGYNSTAFGINSTASGSYSTTMGRSTIADDDFSFVLGEYNDNTTSTTKLFQIGNGIDINNRSNALTILQNGFTAVGTHNNEPTTDFQVNHGVAGTLNGFKLQNSGSNENWWRFYTVNSNGSLYLYSKTGGNSNAVGSFNNVSGAYTALSDRRVKDNFKDLHFNWQSFMQLKPLTYYYKTDKNKQLNIGFIAQDVEPIYPELVNYNKEDNLYQLNYSGFGVVAIKAIQELKSEVKSLSEENKKLKSLLANQEQSNSDQAMVLQTLLDKVEAIEKDIINKKVTIVKN